MDLLTKIFSSQNKGGFALFDKSEKKQRNNPHIIKLVENFRDSSRKDIDKWRKALQATRFSDQPRFNLYHDLIDDLMTDGHLQSQVQLRKLSTLNTDYRVINIKTGKENEEIGFIINQQWFFDFLEICLDSILMGVSLVEFRSFQNEKIGLGLIPRRHVVPTKGFILTDLLNYDFIEYRQEQFQPWILQIGKNEDLGILNNIVPNLIWKRNVAQSWAEFCEKFGLPLITATTNTIDDKIINNVHNMLLQLGEASVGTFPPGTEIKFQEANRTDAYNVYKQFLQSNTDEISKQLVGSTMLSDQGTNRSQTEVHERSLDNKIAQADKRMIQFIINDQLFPLLRYHGYKINDDDYFEFKTAEQEMELPQLWNITNGLLTNGYEVEQEWISKTFNIPITGKRELPPSFANMFAQRYNPDGNEHGKKKRISKALTTDRYAGLHCDCGQHVQAVSKPSQKEIDDFTTKLIEYVFEGKDSLGIEAGLISAEADVLIKGLRSNFKTYNEWAGPDHLMLQMMEYNLFEFAAGKTESRLAAMKELLFDENKELRDFPSFRVEADKVMNDYNHNWLETEYNLSVAVGQNSARYVEFMAEKDTVTSYVKYQTAGDDRVRAAHAALEGKVFSLNDKEAMDLWPPNGYGCRCEMLQFLGEGKEVAISGDKAKSLVYSSDPKYKDSQFEINRGDLKQVFTKKQFYADNKQMTAKINDMTFDKYLDLNGKPLLKPWKDFKDTLREIVLDNTITEDNVKDLFKKVKGEDYMGFTDYLGRKMTMSEPVFNAHTKGKYLNDSEKRHQLFPHIKDILGNPDEVWMFEYKEKHQSRYIKFYKDRMIIIECDFNENNGLKIKSWYNMKIDEKEIRKGLKIK